MEVTGTAKGDGVMMERVAVEMIVLVQQDQMVEENLVSIYLE